MCFNSNCMRNGVNSFVNLSEHDKKRLSQFAIAN